MLASILALYEYDPDVFQYLKVPDLKDIHMTADMIEFPPELNKETLIENILMECAEMSLVYPDPETMQRMVKIWTDVYYPTWCDLYKTLLYKYNPIWNKDGSYTDERTLSRADTGTAASQGSNSVHGDLKNNVTGFDTNAYSPNTQQVTDNSGSFNQSGNTSDNRAENEKTVHTEAGNIGVTTTQQMIREQREIVEFNLYDYITRAFKNKFCVMVY